MNNNKYLPSDFWHNLLIIITGEWQFGFRTFQLLTNKINVHYKTHNFNNAETCYNFFFIV